MAEIKALAKDSMIYGGTTVLGKMMSWMLTVLFTRTLATSEFGIMTNLYAYVAVIIVFLTFGMETGFFRFINRTDRYKPDTVYSTALTVVGTLTAGFLFTSLFFLKDIRSFIWNDDIPDSYIRLVIIILSLDAFCAIPFAGLRYKKRPAKFGFLKILNVGTYTLSCIFLMIVCPWLNRHFPAPVSWFWKEDAMLLYVFVANLAGTGVQIAFLLPEMTKIRFSFDFTLAKKMLHYCFPLVITGFAGMSNQVVDKLVFPVVYAGADWENALGLYSGCFKIALAMMVFTQAFRYAYEPFVFARTQDRDSRPAYAAAMKYFLIFGLLIFLFVMFYIDFLKYFVGSRYWSALHIVPTVLAGELFLAVSLNLSIWYKITGKTWWGTVFSIAGLTVIIALNVIFIPKAGYSACAWASFAGNLTVMLLSYFAGQRYFRIPYDLHSAGIYTAAAFALYAVSVAVQPENIYIRTALNTALLAVYITLIIRRDLPLKDIPYLNRIFK
jgi:O-antigen/teichoic acid export membrane protein